MKSTVVHCVRVRECVDVWYMTLAGAVGERGGPVRGGLSSFAHASAHDEMT